MIVARQIGQMHLDPGQAFGRGRKERPQGRDIRQSLLTQILFELGCEFGLATAVMGQRQKIDDRAASLSFRRPFQHHVEDLTEYLPWKQLIAVDQPHQCHGFFAQRMDDVMIVDDMLMRAVPTSTPAGRIASPELFLKDCSLRH